jgi:Tol biopolymer transport system component
MRQREVFLRKCRFAMGVSLLVFAASCKSDTITPAQPPAQAAGDMVVLGYGDDYPGARVGMLLLPVDGSTPVALRDTATFSDCPSASPDGKRIAFRRRSGIALMDIDGTHIASVTNADFIANPPPTVDGWVSWRLGCPVWSPDSKKLAVVRLITPAFVPGASQLFTMNADGSAVTQIASGDTFDDVSWSPAGDKLLVASHQHTHGGVYGYVVTVMNADGSNKKAIPTSVSGNAWSPSGDRVAVTCAVALNIQPEGRLCVGDSRGDAVTIISADSGSVLYPAWSPDGARIAFGCRLGLCIINPDGTGFQKLAGDSRIYYTGPQWSSDSKRLTYPCVVAGVHGFCVVNADGTNERTLITPTDDYTTVSWVPRSIQ